MTEREMEDLLWERPDQFLNEPLTQFQRQPSSAVGRADLIFEDRNGRLIVVELKHGTLERGAVSQLIDYFGMLKSQFPDKLVELMVVANQIPAEKRLSCQQYNIEPVEISEKKFRDVAERVGYAFQSEAAKSAPVVLADSQLPDRFQSIVAHPADFSRRAPAKYYWVSKDRHPYFLAFVNAKGSCSLRRFDAVSGTFRSLDYKSGDYQVGFGDYIRSAVPLYLSRQPNLERDCRSGLPSSTLYELSGQITAMK